MTLSEALRSEEPFEMNNLIESMEELWPWIRDFKSRCPACPNGRMSFEFMKILEFLVMKHGWSNQQIADWVETIEPKE